MRKRLGVAPPSLSQKPSDVEPDGQILRATNPVVKVPTTVGLSLPLKAIKHRKPVLMHTWLLSQQSTWRLRSDQLGKGMLLALVRRSTPLFSKECGHFRLSCRSLGEFSCC